VNHGRHDHGSAVVLDLELEIVVTEPVEFNGPLGLADFLSDLRSELAEASKRAEGDSLRLGVVEVTVSLDVAVTVAKKKEGSAGAKAKFWVFASVEGGAKAELSSQRASIQHLTLTLKPRIDKIKIDEKTGQVHLATRDLDVSGGLDQGEESPQLPVPDEH
jgi:hypothetical protein